MKKFIILIIVIGVILGISFLLKDAKPNGQGGLNIKNNTLDFNELLGDKVKENNVNEEVVNEEIINEEENNIANEVSSETFEEEPKTEQDKAIDIVKTDWTGNGNSQNVKFTSDGMDANGRYIISVRDKDTTEALAFYTVNVSDKTFTKREMN